MSNRGLRVAALSVTLFTGLAAILLRETLPALPRGMLGATCLIALVAVFSSDLRAVRWRTVGWGLVLQVLCALLILRFEIQGWRPGYALFAGASAAVRQFLAFTNAGAEFVFGGLADQEVMSQVFEGGFVFAFQGLPVIIFVSSFFTMLYYLGVLPVIVRLMARAMMTLMRTSGAETLSAAANVFLGQTEAPLIVKPYVARMTQSELLTIMVGGLATISGGMMAVYIAIGADPVALLTTSVMAAPAGLYLSKILMPETQSPETLGTTRTDPGPSHANIIDAAAAGASDGTMLAINVAAMLIAFLSLLAFVDYLLGAIAPGLSLSAIFATVFAPLSILIGVPTSDVPAVADLLGTKLVANEFVAFLKLTNDYRATITPEGQAVATFALTGFANFGSIGILLGGLGAMVPARRGDLARLSTRALFAGFVATLVNAAIASTLL